MGTGWKCKVEWCGEPSVDHLLCGEVIDYMSWHNIFSCMDKRLKPSDAMPFTRFPHHYSKGLPRVNVPVQRKSSKKNSGSSLTR